MHPQFRTMKNPISLNNIQCPIQASENQTQTQKLPFMKTEVPFYLQQIMSPLHVQLTNILTNDPHDLRTPPPLVDPVHDPFRDPGLPYLQPLLHPQPYRRQPPYLRVRQAQLRQRRRPLPLRRRPLLLLLLLCELVLPQEGGAGAGERDGVLRRAPAGVDGVADAVLGEEVREGYENLAGGGGGIGGGRRRGLELGGGLVGEAEGAELVGDSLDCGGWEGLGIGCWFGFGAPN